MNTLSLTFAALAVVGAAMGQAAAQPFGPGWQDYSPYPWRPPAIARGYAYRPWEWRREWGWRYVQVPAAAAPRPVAKPVPAVPVFDPGPLLGAAVPPPIVVLPPPRLVAASGPPPVIPTPVQSALPITSPAVADAAIPARWRVAGFVTAAYVSPRPIVRRVVRRVPVLRYEPVPAPYVVFADPPPYAEPPPWRHRWHPGWEDR